MYNASTSVAVTNATSLLFLFNVTLHEKSKIDSLRLGMAFQIENPLSCRRVRKADLLHTCKNNFTRVMLHSNC